METVHDNARKERYLRELGLEAHFSTPTPNFLLLHYSPGDLLTTSFSPSQYMQFVVEGKLLLYNMPDESSTVMLQTDYNDVTLLGEMELLDAGFDPFFVEAQTDVYTLAFHLEQYRQQLLNDPAFLRYICRTMAAKLTGAVRATVNLPLKDRCLMSLRYAEAGDRIRDIGVLAKSLDVSRRQLLRVLKALCEEGYLAHDKKGEYLVLRKPEL